MRVPVLYKCNVHLRWMRWKFEKPPHRSERLMVINVWILHHLLSRKRTSASPLLSVFALSFFTCWQLVCRLLTEYRHAVGVWRVDGVRRIVQKRRYCVCRRKQQQRQHLFRKKRWWRWRIRSECLQNGTFTCMPMPIEWMSLIQFSTSQTRPNIIFLASQSHRIYVLAFLFNNNGRW